MTNRSLDPSRSDDRDLQWWFSLRKDSRPRLIPTCFFSNWFLEIALLFELCRLFCIVNAKSLEFLDHGELCGFWCSQSGSHVKTIRRRTFSNLRSQKTCARVKNHTPNTRHALAARPFTQRMTLISMKFWQKGVFWVQTLEKMLDVRLTPSQFSSTRSIRLPKNEI